MRVWLGVLLAWVFAAMVANAQTSVTSTGSKNPGVATPTCISAAAGTSLSCPGNNLYGFYCGNIVGSASGYCVAIDSATVPSNGATIVPLDFCYFDTTPRGCSLAREPGPPRYYTTGTIIILVTSASSPLTYTTGTDTGILSADVK